MITSILLLLVIHADGKCRAGNIGRVFALFVIDGHVLKHLEHGRVNIIPHKSR